MAAPKRDTESAYAELRKMYEPEEKELAQRRGQRGAEALLRAGLAMMSGTSPYAAVNIGRGATEGLTAYQEAQRYDDQAARALRQAQISMRMAERQEQVGNRRDAVTLFSQAQQQQQAAVSSAQQAQQIKQSGEYQQGSLAIMQQNANSNAKLVQARIKALDAPRQQQERMMAEYGKIQKQVMADLSKDVAYTTETDPAKKEQIFRSRINMAISNNPFLANTLFSSTPTGKVRDLLGKDDEED
jgi:flagellar biosynthesis GTPase FlhF